MIDNILPSFITNALKRLDYNRLYEIRLRNKLPVAVNYGGKYYYLKAKGISADAADALTVSKENLNDIAVRACDYSLYSVGNRLAAGFLTIDGGTRIGICGDAVYENGTVKTIKDFNALNIRVAHQINGCSKNIMKYVYDGRIRNTLIVSPPGCGKTTFLRDIAVNLSPYMLNVLIADERCEIAACKKGEPQLDVGLNADVMSGVKKAYTFDCGIRAMRPDVIITDELSGDDVSAVAEAAASGVAVVASVHAYDEYDLTFKAGLERLISSKLIDRYVFLSDSCGPGTVDGVFDCNLNRI